MKQILLMFCLVCSMAASASVDPDVNDKILKSFNETFTTAQNVVWQETDHVFQANFSQGQMKIRARYDDNGNLLGTTRYYLEDQLPPNIIAKLKKKYSGKSIFGVTEVSSDEEVSYFITLQDDACWYTVKSDIYGSLQQTDKFKKAGS